MLRHYLTMTLRGFARHKLYSFINIIGLAVALTCAILILLFVRDQLSYDAWIPGTKDLYRLEVTTHLPGGPLMRGAQCPFPVLRAVGREIPQVKAVTHVDLQGMYATDPKCLDAAYPLTVTGVLRDLPHDMQLVADLMIPNTSRADELSPTEREVDWIPTDGVYGYVKLLPGADPAGVLKSLGSILDHNLDPRNYGIDARATQVLHYQLTPFTDVHLTSDMYGGMRPGGSQPGTVIERSFLSSAFNSTFQSDERQGTLLGIFVGVAIVIACLGLFGLAVFHRRAPHQGGRHPQGLGSPHGRHHETDAVADLDPRAGGEPDCLADSLYYLHRWLERYAYRTSLNPFYFLVAGGVALLIAWATVYANTLWLARAKPVHALRYE